MNNASIQSLKAELTAVNKRNELALQAANLGTWDWNLESGEVIFNELWTKMLGYEHHEVMPHVDGWSNLLHPDDAPKTQQVLQENIEGNSSFYLDEHRVKMKSGAWLWVQARGCVIEYSDDGKPLKHTGTVMDINEQKLRELNLIDSKDHLEQEVLARTSELAESEEKFSAILQLAPEGILTTNSDGIIQFFNEGAQKLFGYSEDEIIGKPLSVLMDNGLQDKHRHHMKKFKNGDVNKIHMAARNDIRGLRKDGSSFVVKVSISRVKVKGDIIFAAIVHDISELTNTRNQMAHATEIAELANRAKTDFLANMSHELRTPLNAIIGYAQLIEQEVIGPISIEGYKGYAGAIYTSGLHLLALIQDILDISKIEAKKQDLLEEPIDLRLVIDACHIMVKEAVREADIEFIISIEEDLPLLFADEKSLKQICLNLLSNAIKFTPSGGKVSLDVYLSETGNIICEFRDTGVGMKEDDIPKILLPFEQIKNANYPQRTQEGTGLGLTIVKSFMDIYGAEMVIDSKLNVGTTVKIIFPSERTVIKAQ